MEEIKYSDNGTEEETIVMEALIGIAYGTMKGEWTQKLTEPHRK